MSERYNWPFDGWWENKERYAQGLSEAELVFACGDCRATAENFRGSDVESKYHDEGSVYHTELAMRRRR